MADRLLRSTLDVEVRSIDEEKRQATFVASTENPVKTWGDPEVLRMRGARLGRYRKNPVLLDTHNRYGLDSVIGSCDVSVEGRELIAVTTYATTDRGETAWRLVKEGHVRSVSIGYSVNPKKVTRLGEGQSDGEGSARVQGPAVIANEWELLEISNVPIPADENAVRRKFYDSIKEHAVNETEMAAAAPAPVTTETTTAHAAPGPSVPAVRAADEIERAAILEARRRQVLAITPVGLEGVATRGLLEGLSVEEIRQRLLTAQADRFKPLGTSEPVETPAPKADEQRGKPLPEWVTDEVLVRSLEGLSD